MSIVNMESWMLFGAHNGDDGQNTAIRAAYTKAYIAAGYEYFQQNLTAGWIIRQHPLYPERQALVFSAGTPDSVQYHIRKPLKGSGGITIGGFSIFIPGEFIRANGNASSPYPVLGVFAGAPGSAMNKFNFQPTLQTDEIFRIRYDLQIARGQDVQSSRLVPIGKLAYIEYRITPTELRVWLDDSLVYQGSISVDQSTIGIGMISWQPAAGTSQITNAAGRWAISDWYNLKEDAEAPNVRLGPSTRVIGVRPVQDVVAQFARPSNFSRNAAVAAQALNPDTTMFLKTDTVGATDIYNGPEDSATATAALVHAMSTKVIAMNMESAAHSMVPLLVSGDVQQGTAVALTGALAPITNLSTIDPNTGEAWRPAAAAISKFGMKLQS